MTSHVLSQGVTLTEDPSRFDLPPALQLVRLLIKHEIPPKWRGANE